MREIHKPYYVLAAIAIAALAPFLTKAFHHDDPLFFWMAQQIAKQPHDPYGFVLNAAGSLPSAFARMHHPPLCSYYIALAGGLLGWSEFVLHAAFLLWAALTITGAFAVARRFCAQPALAALCTFFTPVLLVSGSNLGGDLMLLALWLWSIESWLRGLDQDHWPLFLISAVLISLAALTDYFGLALVPLLLIYTVTRDWKRSGRGLFLLIPIATVTAFALLVRSKYGSGPPGPMAAVPSSLFGERLLVGLAFLGGALVSPALFIWSKRWLTSLIAIAMVVAASKTFYFYVPIDPSWNLGANLDLARFEGAVFTAIGSGLLIATGIDLVRRRRAEDVFLALWLGGTFVFAAFFRHEIDARAFLPLAPAAAIFLVRQVDFSRQGFFRIYWRVVPAAAISLGVAAADYTQADVARAAADFFRQRFLDQRVTVWFQGEAGFQYYMQRWNARPFEPRSSPAESGDLIVVPGDGRGMAAVVPSDRIFPPEKQEFDVLPWISAAGPGTGASFYSSRRGPIPWAIDYVGPETFYIARFR